MPEHGVAIVLECRDWLGRVLPCRPRASALPYASWARKASVPMKEQAPRSEAHAPCEVATLFELMWTALVDLLGSAATATLLRRSVKRATSRVPELANLTIKREGLEYCYVLPPAWKERTNGTGLSGLHEVARELEPLLVELTGPVVIQRLRGIRELERCRVFLPENE